MVLPPFSHVTVGSAPDRSAPLTAQNKRTSEPSVADVSHGLITNVGAADSVGAVNKYFYLMLCELYNYIV